MCIRDSTVRGQCLRNRRWCHQYNHERPHEALGMQVPAALYRKSWRKMPRRMKAWRYPRGWESRLVRSKGMITFYGQSRFVGEAFEAERIGLKPLRRRVWEVYFGPLLVGELWESKTGAIRAAYYRRRGRRR